MTQEIAVLICLFCLILQSMIWFVTDPRNYKERLKDTFEAERFTYYVIAASFMTIYVLSSFYLIWPAGGKESAWISFGLIVYISGTSIATWARFAMNKYWGLPAKHDIKRQSHLITHGPFSYSRNPIYFGSILLFVGFSLVMRSYSILLVPIVVYAIYHTILAEEHLLLKYFGKEYERYMKKVPRFL